jgi:hypothetical protein
MSPVLTLLVAGSIQLAAETPRTDFACLAFELTRAVEVLPGAADPAEPPLGVCDIPFYYSDFSPVRARETPILVTYDWRTPVIFDLP